MQNAQLVPAQKFANMYKPWIGSDLINYHEARKELLEEEIELRRHIERVSELRRALPPGPLVEKTYHFAGAEGAVTLSDIFRDKDTLVIYNYMYPADKNEPCPMCTSLMTSYAEKMKDINQHISLAFIARSPYPKLRTDSFKRGIEKLNLYADESGEFTRDFVSPKDDDYPALNVFQKKNGEIRLFWRDEITMAMKDPGQDPRGAVELDSLWNLLDITPHGRGGPDWRVRHTY